jgi:hypothetical protein
VQRGSIETHGNALMGSSGSAAWRTSFTVWSRPISRLDIEVGFYCSCSWSSSSLQIRGSSRRPPRHSRDRHAGERWFCRRNLAPSSSATGLARCGTAPTVDKSIRLQSICVLIRRKISHTSGSADSKCPRFQSVLVVYVGQCIVQRQSG